MVYNKNKRSFLIGVDLINLISELEELPPEFHAKMIGKLLGDGTIVKQDNRQPRFQFSHTINDQQWTMSCFNELKDYCPLSIPYYRKIIDKRMKKGYSENFTVQSRTSEIFNILHGIWYKDRKKVIPFEYVKQYFSTVSLAWWYQDDGYLKRTNHKPSKVVLSTECFTSSEITQLRNLLYKQFHLCFHIDKQKRLILYDAASIYYFLSIIQSDINPSMYRKTIKYQFFRSFDCTSKRSSIYLPADVNITQPTYEINKKLKHLEYIWNKYKENQFFNDVYLPNLNNIRTDTKTKGYQIVIKSDYMSLLWLLKANTGLTYSQLAMLCFQME